MSSREEDVLRALANPIGLKLFKLIATNATSTDSSQVITSDFLNSQTKVTRKQFYSNMSRLVNKTGLIFKKSGRYTLSNYGKVVFQGLDIINRGSECFWALKALDKNEISSAGIPAEQMLEISARLIEDEDIRMMIVSGPMDRDRLRKDGSMGFTIRGGGKRSRKNTGEKALLYS